MERDVDVISPSQENYPVTRPFLSEALKDQQNPEKFYKKKGTHLSRYPGESEPNDHIHTTHRPFAV